MEYSSSDVHEEITIMRVLGIEPCARAILDHVPFRDLVRSERVSRQWQQAVNEYLREQPLTLHDVDDPYADEYLPSCDKYVRERLSEIFDDLPGYEKPVSCHVIPANTHRKIYIPFRYIFNCPPLSGTCLRAFEKWRASIVKVETSSFRNLEIIASNCPNVQHVMFYEMCLFPFYDKYLTLATEKNQEHKILKKISLKNMNGISDGSLVDFLQNIDFKEIEISNCALDFTFSFLEYIPARNYTSLSINSCKSFRILNHSSEPETLGNVTSLELDYNHKSVFENVHLLLNKMPYLENLSLCGYCYDENEHFVDSVTRLSNLKCLKITTGGYGVTDAPLEALAQGCCKLEYVDIGCNPEGSRAVAALCRRPHPMVINLSFDENDVDLQPDEELLSKLKNKAFFSELEALGMRLTWYPQMMRKTGKVELDVGCAALPDKSTQHILKISLLSYHDEPEEERVRW